MRAALTITCLLLVACPGGSDDDDSAEPTPRPEAEAWDFDAAAPWYPCPDPADVDPNVVWVDVFDGEDQYFGEPNLRNIAAEVALPEGEWKQVGLWFQLECPTSAGGCDDWDRAGSLSVVEDMSVPEEERRWVELARHVTPYNRGMCQFVDVTGYSPVLAGTRAFDSWIDTWVGPGHQQGDGWITTAKLAFFPGEDPGRQLINVWGRRNVTVGEIEAGASVADQIEPVTVDIPEASRVTAHLTTTGHSFGNRFNCAEFCQMNHDLRVGDEWLRWGGWRSDCDQNPVSPQDGTWTYPRNGWCPGAIAVGGFLEVADRGPLEVDLDIRLNNGDVYDNTTPVDLLPYTFVSLQLFVEP